MHQTGFPLVFENKIQGLFQDSQEPNIQISMTIYKHR